MPSQISSALNPKATGRGAAIFLCLFALPFAGFGTFATIKGLTGLISGRGEKNIGVLAVVGVVFSIIGYGLIALTVVMYRSTKRDAALRAAHPEQPWLWRKDWADGRINSSSKSTMVGAWIIAAFWNTISSGVFVSIATSPGRPGAVLLIAAIFPLVGIGLLAWTVYATVQWRKFGQSTFKLLSAPGVVGGRLAGAIETSIKIKPEDGFHLKLVCINRVRTGSGRDSSVTETVLWEGEKTMVKELLDDDPRRSGIPVSFQIPPDAAESSDRDPNNRISWRLEARAKVPGIKYAATFEVPVFETAESAKLSATEADPALAYEAPEEPFKLPPHSRIKVKALPDGGTEFYFPPARNLGTLLNLTVFFLVWTAFTVFADLASKTSFFEIAFTLVDAMLVCACFYYWLRSSRVTVNSASVRVTNHWLFMGPTRVFDTRDVAGFETKSGMRSGQKVFYNLQLRTNGGKKMTVAGFIPGKDEADWLCDELARSLRHRA